MNILKQLPTEVKLQILRDAENKTNDIFDNLEDKEPMKAISHLLESYSNLYKESESSKWFLAEKNKDTFNQMVEAYEAKIEELNEVIQKKVKRLN